MPDEHVYNELLMAEWRALLDSLASRDERLPAFFERHPLLLPGSFTVDGDSGHAAYLGIISRPKLPGLSDQEPDLMWLTTDSESLYPVLVEIVTPYNRWFYLRTAPRSTATSPTRRPARQVAGMVATGNRWRDAGHGEEDSEAGQPAVIRRYLADARAAATSDAKGKLYEELVRYLFDAVPGCMAERNLSNVFRTEQIDVAVGNARSGDGLWLLPHVILVECKHCDKPVDSSTGATS